MILTEYLLSSVLDTQKCTRCTVMTKGKPLAFRPDIIPTVENFRADYPWKVCNGTRSQYSVGKRRMIVPIWVSYDSGKEFGPGRLGHRPSVH